MKKAIYLLIIGSIFLSNEMLHSQQSNIDPRQYVEVLYKKKANELSRKIAWKWETSSYLPKQRLRILDINGLIEINFDKKGLSENYEFLGNISLAAEISGKNGNRKIEVSPYSEVGVQRKNIGINSLTPSELSTNIINLITELLELYNTNIVKYNISNDFKFVQSDILTESINEVIRLIESYKSDKSKEFSIETASDTAFFNFISKNLSFFSQESFIVSKFLLQKNKPSLNELKIELETLSKNYKTRIQNLDDEKRKAQLESYLTLYKKIIVKNRQIRNYLNLIDISGNETKMAFLSLINRSNIFFKESKTAIEQSLHTLESSLKKLESSNSIETLSTFIYVDGYDAYQSSLTYLFKLSNILTGKLIDENERKEIFDNKVMVLSDTSTDVLKKQINDFLIGYNLSYTDFLKLSILKNYIVSEYEKVQNKISTILAPVIYKKLIYATIDLGKSGAAEGEVLHLFLNWLNLDGDTTENRNLPTVLSIGKYTLQETGWKTEVSESFAFVERIREYRPIIALNTSPSNFKGAGGVSVMRTFYYKDFDPKYNGIKESDSSGIKYKKGFLNVFQPSFGINVSYIDFDTEKDLEIGTAIQLGVFKNLITFGYGVNLHKIRPGEYNAGYFMLGFSFTNLLEKLKTNKDTNISE